MHECCGDTLENKMFKVSLKVLVVGVGRDRGELNNESA